MQTAKTPAALKRLIQMRLDALSEAEDGEQIFARDVQWHALDEDGRNWDMSGYRGPAAYAREVRMVVDRLRREYSLEQDAAW